ncbi:hypothetical protein BBBOND_0307290 [Babesia bigemina]|uniref:Uncharacterized protein n=1 Tax=Babesia bigemina TaxID=5866 RepID=A0A061DE51_BABBI|nr:hypothetical protein BBBOND_0307290 [Babesia bigemina]CDR96825.1 hypothetical protein BBBOND_0307290 [Babesia bigemina]|eukprot:XP_012769011.1 hypothetical protein BBBOND_0307290 [Babesia bigemina]
MVIAARIGSVSCGDLTYRLLAVGCEARCRNMFPRQVTKDTVASPYDNATYADFGDIKLFSCLEACRMALTAYPKDEEEIRRNDEISKSRGP